MKFFNDTGRRLPSESMRVFGKIANSTYHNPSYYYRIEDFKFDYNSILKNSIDYGLINKEIDLNTFQSSCEELLKNIKIDSDFNNLLNGPYLPFIISEHNFDDLGEDLELNLLPKLNDSFNNKFPENHFKAILQSDSELKKNITIDPNSRYDIFIECVKKNTVVGWYFPCALQEFDVDSQRKQMLEIPSFQNICLSGGIDICASIIGSPDLLINSHNYAPILCMSAYIHRDPRLVLLLKSYGPHLEFWCMTQMLQKNIKQVSEQWAGGITIYTQI